jgi:hypothetical protein
MAPATVERIVPLWGITVNRPARTVIVASSYGPALAGLLARNSRVCRFASPVSELRRTWPEHVNQRPNESKLRKHQASWKALLYCSKRL